MTTKMEKNGGLSLSASLLRVYRVLWIAKAKPDLLTIPGIHALVLVGNVPVSVHVIP